MPSARGGLSLEVRMEVEEGSSALKDALSESEEWLLALRIAASKGLCKSEFLPRFLLYVCEQNLTASGREMTEQHLGVQVFNRPQGYNPGEDNIVRSYARMLRKRLEEYFEGEGQNEPLRLTIPRGGYVPLFSFRGGTAAESALPAEAEDVTAERMENGPASAVRAAAPLTDTTEHPDVLLRQELTGWRPMWLWGLVLFLAGAAGALIATSSPLPWHTSDAKGHEGPAHALWVQVFRNDRNTLIVPADSGLGILQNLTGHLVSLEEYTNGTYLSGMKPPAGISLENLDDLRRQRYTSVVDLNIASTLTQLPEFNPTRSAIRYARSVTTEDLKSSNAILLGSSHTNPWVSLFESRLNFVLRYTPEVNQSFVVNKQPLGGEAATYNNGVGGAANKTYGLVDYLPSLDGNGHVLLIQGLNMAATQAAAEVLANKELMRPVLRQAERPDGTLCAFELLVQTSSIGASAPESKVVCSRFYHER